MRQEEKKKRERKKKEEKKRGKELCLSKTDKIRVGFCCCFEIPLNI